MSGVPAASATFSAHAPEYTALRRALVPGYDQLYGSAVDALSLPGVREIARVLDLGAGTGLMTAHVADRLPDARFDLLDGSAEMLEEARATLGELVADVHVTDMTAGLPAGPYDAVISALAIHHLDDADKRVLFGRVCDVLAPGGVFVNAEQLGGPTPEIHAAFDARWAADAVAQGASEAQIAGARERRRHDREATVEQQLGWLREAGFAVVDCLYRSWGYGTLVAIKGAGA